MNFLETHDLVGGVQPLTESPQQSFNEEVNQVVGQLSRFWGGFRKQVGTVGLWFATAQVTVGAIGV